MLPDVLAPGRGGRSGQAAAAAELGLPEGALVGPGTGDNMAAALGLGLAPGEPVVSLGTSGTAYAAMTERAVDPSGLIAGFADATGGFLPLAATLNCTLAVDRFADWLGIEREAVAESTEATVLPYLDGERTPNLPRAAGTIAGLRHDTTREQILLAAYEGAAASLIEALRAAGHDGLGTERRRAGRADRRRSARRGVAAHGGPPGRPRRSGAAGRGARGAGRGSPGGRVRRAASRPSRSRGAGTRGAACTVDPPEEVDTRTLDPHPCA